MLKSLLPTVGNATVQNSELPAGAGYFKDTHEKAERLDLNCIFDDANQADIEEVCPLADFLPGHLCVENTRERVYNERAKQMEV